MGKYKPLEAGTGTRQKVLLRELHAQGVITINRETNLWTRGPYSSKTAKSLLTSSDQTIDEQIKGLEPAVLRLEADAKSMGVKLSGGAREKLNKMYELKKSIYG